MRDLADKMRAGVWERGGMCLFRPKKRSWDRKECSNRKE